MRPANKPGQRSDLDEAVRLLEEGKSPMEIIKCNPGLLKYSGHLRWYYDERKALLSPAPSVLVLREWQTQVLTWLSGSPISRRIYWIWSTQSARGKSTFYQYCCTKFNVLPGCLELRDTMRAYNGHPIIWFDLSRSDPLDAKMSSQLETLSSGGWVMSWKYEPVRKLVCSHIVVSCNRPPIHDRLPQRIQEWCLDEFPNDQFYGENLPLNRRDSWN